jgi:hypothetical protein
VTTTEPIVDVLHPASAPRLTSRLLNGYMRLANKPLLACAFIFFLTLGFRIALLPWLHVPKPAVHDEFSYLLAADTFASGRLTNPPHKYWEHFETFHVLQQPTYASKYQPMQGLVLAFGQKILGVPWAGVLLSSGLMCAIVCWTLQGWMSPGAALLGGLLLMLRVGVLTYWVNSYWGGCVPAIAVALTIGSIPRIVRRRQYFHAVTFAVGLAILGNSRPYEAAVLAIASAAALGWWLWKTKVDLRVVLLRVAAPVIAVLAITAVGMAYYNYRVTGNPLSLPYQVHDQQYDMVSMFAWSKARAQPVYHHEVMRKFWAVWHVDQVNTAHSAMTEIFLAKIGWVYDFFFGLWPLLIPPLVWPYALKKTEERLTLFFLIAFTLALLPITGFAPHYAAAFACLAYLRFLQTLTRLLGWTPWGKPLGFAVAVFFVVMIPYQFGAEIGRVFRNGEYIPMLAIARDPIVQTLEKQPGRQLVMVRYSPTHNVHDEWVYNRADIDASPIVWAREMTPEQDRPFIQYFHDRKVWLLEPDQTPPKLVPYDLAAQQGIAR